jgi:hypothetical protein
MGIVDGKDVFAVGKNRSNTSNDFEMTVSPKRNAH